MKYRNVYVAASSQHVGKTTSTLGLVSAYEQHGLEVGYCKPVGQKFLDLKNLRVDKDTLLFADLLHFELNPELHSPIILGPGATQMYLDNPKSYELEARILHAKEFLSKKNEIVIYEGTGHPGVGSVANFSNARVAKLLDAGVIMIVEGGIGRTIDMLNMCLALFREEGVPLIGVIINKVKPEKSEKVKHYVGKWLDRQGIPLLGLIPYDKSLAYPLIQTVQEAIKGNITHFPEFVENKVENILAGSLVDLKELKTFENLLLVASVRTVDRAIRKVSSFSNLLKLEKSPLSGIVVTGEGKMDEHAESYISKHKLPVIRSAYDTYGAVIKISRIEVKINRSTPWKIQRAIELIRENVNLDLILERSRLD
jgi:dethiobiotin synthetase